MFDILLVTSVLYILRSGVRIFTQSTENSEGITKLIMAGEKRISQKKILAYRKITHL